MTVVDPPTDAGTLAPVDSATIRTTYYRVLYSVALPEGEEFETLCSLVQGHVQLLLPEVQGIGSQMCGEMRTVAVHVVVRARHLLDEIGSVTPATRESYVYDLATTARTLLLLKERPGPLGEPLNPEEFEAPVGQRVCGACFKEIPEGTPTERRMYASDPNPGVFGYVHVEPCAGRRPQLVPVPPQGRSVQRAR
ncbi:DUF6415 family natural product biosynthesis protein [Streptomyces sp. NPDC005474]|uniref:DUF6415 family natural product biosynthesis protein n=1 Tax=Streptomyces sp. NPDC005474 TaxID=3154878 RepID=UPI003451954D